MQITLDNRTALVTAATKGIGLAIAVGLRQAGATVTISGRSAQSVEAALQQINQQPGPPPATGVVADPGTAEGAAAQVLELLGPDPMPVDELGRRCQLSRPDLAALLTDLELAGRIESLPGNRVALLP